MKNYIDRDTFRWYENDKSIEIAYNMDMYNDRPTRYEDHHRVEFNYKGLTIHHFFNGESSLVHDICPDICKAIDAEGKEGWDNYKSACNFFNNIYSFKVMRSNNYNKKYEYVLVNNKVYKIEVYRMYDRSILYEDFEIKILLSNGIVLKEQSGNKKQSNQSRPPELKKYKECLEIIRKQVIDVFNIHGVLPSENFLDKDFTTKYRGIKKWLDDLNIKSITEKQFGDY
jgi:hypothetical protein